MKQANKFDNSVVIFCPPSRRLALHLLRKINFLPRLSSTFLPANYTVDQHNSQVPAIIHYYYYYYDYVHLQCTLSGRVYVYLYMPTSRNLHTHELDY